MADIDRKELKRNAKINLKRNYWVCVVVTFITVVLLGGGYYYNKINIEKNVQDNNINIAKNNDFVETNYNSSNSDLINELIENILNKKEDNNSLEKKEEFQKKYDKGILSGVVNQLTSKEISIGFINSINILLSKGDIHSFVLSLIFTFLSVVFFFLIKNVIVIGKIRFFLEERRYNTKVGTILFPYRIKKTLHYAWILFCQYVFQFLWALTIIGGIIKSYEYSFIPYVLAENPEINRKQAFKLSKELTNNLKWKMFVLDLSLLGWGILGVITLGFSNLLFFNPYKECIYAELYMNIRKQKIDELTDKELLKGSLLDIDEVQDTEYPMDKFIIPEKKIRKWLNTDYKRNYSLQNLILFFFIFSFIGYSYEVMIHIVKDGVFVNRGSLYGPWLPIYGFGGVLILVALKKFRDKPFKLFLSAFILCGFVEYIGAWLLETFKHIKYWDYSGYFFNIQGRVCLEGLLVFGLGGCVFTYLLGPMLDNLCNKINPKIKNYICIILLAIILGDYGYSTVHPNVGAGITDYPE